MAGTGRLHNIYEQYGDRVQFLKVYVREAHASDGWWFGGGLGLTGVAVRQLTGAATDVADPKTLVERRAVAARCVSELGIGMTTLVDDIDDAVNKAYCGWPTRLYLIGTDGRVVYQGGPGPFGFSPKALGAAIQGYLKEA